MKVAVLEWTYKGDCAKVENSKLNIQSQLIVIDIGSCPLFSVPCICFPIITLSLSDQFSSYNLRVLVMSVSLTKLLTGGPGCPICPGVPG